MAFYDSSCQDFPDTGKTIGAYTIFYQCGTIDNDTHVPVALAQSSAESEYNTACTSGMALETFRMLINELFNKDPEIFPEEDPLIVLDSKSVKCLAKYIKYSKHTSHIARIMNLITNG